jgi:tetratricopeptide (TPR) repeat protein
VFCIGSIQSQNRKIDSLKSKLQTQKLLCGACTDDTGRVLTIINLSKQLKAAGQRQQALNYSDSAFDLAVKYRWKRGQAKALINSGIVNSELGNSPGALKNYFDALKLFEQTKNKRGIASARNNIGAVYSGLGQNKEALENYFAALKIDEESGDRDEVASCYSNIGRQYAFLGEYEEALKYHFKDLKLKTELKNVKDLVYTYNNLGFVYRGMKNYQEALKYYNLFLDIAGEYNRDLEVPYTKLGSTYFKLGQYKTAFSYLMNALTIAQKDARKESMQEVLGWLSQVDSAMGNYRDSYTHYKLHILYRDSLVNEENTKKIIQSQMQYDFDRKSAADSIKNSESKKVEEVKHQHEISRQKTFTYGGVAGFLVMIVVAGVSYKAFRNKKKANVEIQKQKHLVEEKQKEILDSIRYAKRIQTALLTSEKYVARNLNKLNIQN